MIRARAALTRQVQDFFHQHLVGLFSWEEITFDPKQKIDMPSDPKERRKVYDRHDDKFHERIVMEFGRYDLTVESPAENPPLGLAKLRLGNDTVSGPLDPATWSKFADFIRTKENRHGRSSPR